MIANCMTPAVIHLLEIIDIDQQNRKFNMIPLGPGKFLLKEYLCRAPVWDSRQNADIYLFHCKLWDMLEPQMFDRLPVVDQFFERINTDAQVHV